MKVNYKVLTKEETINDISYYNSSKKYVKVLMFTADGDEPFEVIMSVATFKIFEIEQKLIAAGVDEKLLTEYGIRKFDEGYNAVRPYV